MIDEAVSMLKKCERTFFIEISDGFFLFISAVLTIVFISLWFKEKPKPSIPEINISQMRTQNSQRSEQRERLFRRRQRHEQTQSFEISPLVSLQSSSIDNQSPTVSPPIVSKDRYGIE